MAKGMGTFIPKKPVTKVGTMRIISSVVRIRKISFKLLFKTLL